VIFAVPWSIASVVDTDGRQKFDQFFRQLLAGDIKDHPVPGCLAGMIDQPPSDNRLIYDYCWKVRRVVGNESVPKIIVNGTINLFAKTAISILAISNRSSFRVPFVEIASVYFI